MTTRISNAFAKARAENRGVLGVFVTAGDPDADTSARILDALVDANVDMVELGMPFSDPMADGPAIQAASLRALKKGMTLAGTLEIAAEFRKRHPDTPLILMGYYNPIYIYGVDRFLDAAVAAGSGSRCRPVRTHRPQRQRGSGAAVRQRLRRPLSTLSCRGGKLANSLLADCGTVRRVFQQNPAITRGDLCETRRRGWPVTPKPAEGTKRRGQMALLHGRGGVASRRWKTGAF